MSTFTLKSVVVEEVPAWEVCPYHNDINEHPQIKCGSCHGVGGAWHEAVADDDLFMYIENDDEGNDISPVFESTILTREWVCRPDFGHHNQQLQPKPCNFCTAGEWGIKDG